MEEMPVIVTSKKIEELVIPSSYKIVDENYLATWCDINALVKLIYSEINFMDGEVKGKTIKNYYLDIDKGDEFNKSKILSF